MFKLSSDLVGSDDLYKALREFELEQYRKSYYTLEPMRKKYPEQNELKLLMEEALERGKYRIGIVSDRLFLKGIIY